MTQNTNTQTSQADHITKQLGLKYPCSEVGNMERFVDQHHNHVRFIPQNKCWVVWDGIRWNFNSTATVNALAIETVRSIYDEAKGCEHEEGRKQLTRWVMQSQSNRLIQSMISMAAKHPNMVASINDFDTDDTKVNCLNGVVDLKTGELLERTSSDLFMKLAPVSYDKYAKCPAFSRFLHQIFDGDVELISWMQRALGYTLTGLTTEQLLFLAYGRGANGKSTLFECLLDILGDYARSAEFDTFLATDGANNRVKEGIAKLHGIRFALASETDSTKRFSEALVKKITGGDTLTGFHPYAASFEFRPNFKLWLLANHLPIAKDGSYGFWRRMRVIPFNRCFTEHEKDQRLSDKLKAEAEGIFAWCVRGAVNWHKELKASGGRTGIGSCSAVDEATNIYKADNDIFGQFIETCLVQTDGSQTPAKELYSAYERWCEDEGEVVCSQTIFGSRLKERGYEKTRKASGWYYLHLQVKEAEDDF